MVKKEYNVSIKREFYRASRNGEQNKFEYPQAFGDEGKNNFIKSIPNGGILISAPEECSLSKAYNKFEEITNVVYVELYYLNEMILPTEMDFKCSYISLNISLNNYIDKYENIINNFNKNVVLLKNIYGECKISQNGDALYISNIRANYLNKNGFSEDDLRFWMAFIYMCIDESANNVNEMISKMNEACNKYHLKYTQSISEVEKDIETRINSEEKLTAENKIELAKKYSDIGYDTRYCLQKYGKIACESVVLIKDAISQGINYEVLNENKSVVELDSNGHKEFVIEGNKTDRDTYIFPILTDDKFTAKQILRRAGVNVPEAILLEKEMDEDEIIANVEEFFDKKLVVKPRNTNYGIGITVFSEPATREQIMNAINYAFRFDDNVLIENYVKGMEYRFLVIDGKCLSVSHRRIASVIGDGHSTIDELINEKNEEPWHRLTAAPVKKDEPVIEYLKLQNRDFNTVVPKGERVFLRTNSNVSTGGESVLYTNIMPERFKRVAEKAAGAFRGKICGVDIIIDDMEKDDYAIIEINDNPGYSINEWPYEPNEGRGDKIGISILKMLGLIS